MLNFLDEAVLFILGLVIVVLPFLRHIDLGSTKNRFVWLVSLSFLGPVLYYGTQLLGVPVQLPVNPVHALLWSMLLTSFLAFYFRRQEFFWAQLAVPLAMFLPFLLLGRFILELGAVIALVSLSEILVFAAMNGRFTARVLSIFGIFAAFFSIVYFYPVTFLSEQVMQLFLVVSWLAVIPMLWLFYIHGSDEIRLDNPPEVRYIWYALYAILVALFVGLYSDIFGVFYASTGFFAITSLSAIHADSRSIQGIADFLAVSFITFSVLWLGITLFDVGFRPEGLVFRFNITLLELMVLSAVGLVGLKIVKDRRL